MYIKRFYKEHKVQKVFSFEFGFRIKHFVIDGIESSTTKWILGGMKESLNVIIKGTIRILKLMNVSMEVKT